MSIKSFSDYKHLLQENYMAYKRRSCRSVLMCCKKKLLDLSYILEKKMFVFHIVFLRSLINVLYVNKQEFNASSWRSNQGYTKMHGQPTIKICNAKQARQVYQYKEEFNKCICVNKQEFNASSWRPNQGYKMCVLISSTFLSETFLTLRRNERDMIKKMYIGLHVK